jgi:hypothetical protein
MPVTVNEITVGDAGAPPERQASAAPSAGSGAR